MVLIVDGMNVIGARPDGWWRDRAAARLRLVADLVPLAAGNTAVTVVFDGRPGPGESEGPVVPGLTVAFAPGGPNAADDAIVTLLDSLTTGTGTIVVTSDRALADRVRRRGAVVEGVATFRSRLDRCRDGSDARPRRRPETRS